MAEGQVCGTVEEVELKQILIQDFSWTKTVPYRYWHSYVKPSDSIGSIFTPGTYQCRSKTLIKRAAKPLWHPFGIDGTLVDPPRIFIERHNEEVKRRAAEKEYGALPNIVNLRDLADGTWLRKKSRKAKIQKKRELAIQKGRITKRKLEREVMKNIVNTWYNPLFRNIS